ncbi:MAG: tetratricopeptide repeat protein [Acidimicrobiia bacterium]|nr:tetratricopeptide repeat protein [Acidimicrobiia bacterium]
MKNFEDPYEELEHIAGKRAERAIPVLQEAAQAFQDGRERDALRIIKPLVERYPSAQGVQELYGMSLYANGKYEQALKVLEEFTSRTKSYDQLPLIMDCYRSFKEYDKVDKLWRELGEVSPDGAVTAEGRIVHSQSLAEQGNIEEALRLLRKKVKPIGKPKQHHLRLWYCLADLEERAGNIIAARQWFERLMNQAPNFADVKDRLDALS